MDQEELKNFKTLAARGDAEAQFQLGEYYWELSMEADNENEEIENLKEAVKWYKAAALQNHLPSMVMLGEIYETGVGEYEDYEEAARWYRLAADQGDDDRFQIGKQAQQERDHGKTLHFL